MGLSSFAVFRQKHYQIPRIFIGMANIVTCPKCRFTFDVGYSRISACKGCPSSAMGDCGYIKCPKCEHEFPKE